MPVFAHPEWNANTNVSGNNVDTEGKNGYNDERGDSDVNYQRDVGGSAGGNQEGNLHDSTRESQTYIPRREDAESFARRTQQIRKTSDRKIWNNLSVGKYNVAYTHREPDSSNVQSENIKQVITSAALEVAFAHPEWNVNTNVSDNNVDTDVENGYNSERGGNSADFEQGRNRENSEEIAGAVNSGGKNQTEATRGGNKENHLRGTQSGQNEGRPGERVHVIAGNQKISFVLKEVDNSVAGNAVRILNNMGIEAVLCDGEIIAENGSHPTYSQALTLPNGVVYVSSNATLSDVEIAAHEAVHVNEINGTDAFMNYEGAICDNINWSSETYKTLAKKINEGHYNGKYDIASHEFAKLFIREISAYVNQYITTNLEFAESNFSDLFHDWNAVVEASRQFNKDIGADFSESASFMPENSSDNDSESVLPDMSAAAPESDVFLDTAYADRGLERLTDEQRQIKAIGKALGREVEFKNLDRWRKDKNGR